MRRSGTGAVKPRVRVGAEVLVEEQAHRLRGRRVAILTNGAAIDGQARWVVDRLVEAGAQLVALFAPEHGLRGEAQAGVPVGDAREPRWGVPVYSLYGAHRRPTPESLDGVELFLCDLPDGGCRYWTFVATATQALEACGEQGIPFLLLDRPNPVGGLAVEGNVLDPAFRSLVGAHPMAIRHGLTAGEAGGDPRPGLGPGLALPGDGPALGGPLAQHAQPGDASPLPGHLPGGRDQPLRGTGDHPPLPLDRGALDRRGAAGPGAERAGPAGGGLPARLLHPHLLQARRHPLRWGGAPRAGS